VLLAILPYGVLLVMGLRYGLSSTLPIYLVTLSLCVIARWHFFQKRAPWKDGSFCSILGFGGLALITGNIILFQLQLSMTIVLVELSVAYRWIRGTLDLLELPFDPKLLGPRVTRLLLIGCLLCGLGLAALNGWISLTQPEMVWLFFRVFAPLTVIAAFSILGMYLMVKQTKASSA
jgi:intracellular septation protein A